MRCTATTTRACQCFWLLLGLTFVVEGRMLPNSIEPCKYTWQLPGTDCWPPLGQSPHCDHLHSEGCAGSPPTVVPMTTATAGADQVVQVVATEWEDPDCKPIPGRLPPIHCQDPSAVYETKGGFSQYGRTEVPQDPDCTPVPGRLPPIHCQDPSAVHVTKGGFSQYGQTELPQDPDCTPVPGRLPPIHCQDPSAAHVTTGGFSQYGRTEVPEDPDCKPVPGRLPPIHCQDPSMKGEERSSQTAKLLEACQYTWQLPGTDCWPPIGQSPRCDHLNSEGCRDSPPVGI